MRELSWKGKMESSGKVSKSSSKEVVDIIFGEVGHGSDMAVSSDDRSIDMGIRYGALVQDSINPINGHSSGASHERGRP
jgi:hypothetical protein